MLRFIKERVRAYRQGKEADKIREIENQEFFERERKEISFCWGCKNNVIANKGQLVQYNYAVCWYDMKCGVGFDNPKMLNGEGLPDTRSIMKTDKCIRK